MSNISVLNRVICVPVHVIVHTFLIVGKPTESKRPTAGLSLRESIPADGNVALLCSISHERTNVPRHRRFIRGRGERKLQRLPVDSQNAQRARRRPSPLARSATACSFSPGWPARSSARRYHLCRTDRGAAGRLMISRCMANAANCRPGRNWARRDAAASSATTRCSLRRRVRINDVEREKLSRRFRSVRHVFLVDSILGRLFEILESGNRRKSEQNENYVREKHQ